MSSIFSQGGPQFGVNDVKIGAWNGDGSYGTMTDVPSVRSIEVQFQTVNGMLEGDDAITAAAAYITSAQVRFQMGSVKPEVLEVLMQANLESSGGTRQLRIGSDIMQYFGLVAKANAGEGAGDTHIFLPKLKVMEGFSVRFEYGQFATPELVCTALVDANFTDAGGRSLIGYFIDHDTAADIATLPPADAQNGA
jgi:hypothetical protein